MYALLSLFRCVYGFSWFVLRHFGVGFLFFMGGEA